MNGNHEPYCCRRLDRRNCVLTGLVLMSMLLAACVNATPTVPPPTAVPPTAVSPVATATSPAPIKPTVPPSPLATPTFAPSPLAAPATGFVSKPSRHTTESGFVCPEPQPRVEVTSEQLNLFVWSEYVPADIVECFEAVYGITVNQSEYSSNEEMYAKLSAGGSTFDVAQPSDYIIEVMIRTGVLQKLDRARLPNLANIEPVYAHAPGDPNGEYIAPYQVGTESIVYNADTVKEPLTSWKDLWRPDLTDRLVFVDDQRYVIGFVLLSEGYDPNTTNPADLQAIKPKLAELISHVRVFDSDSPKNALIAGDVDAGFVFNGEAFLAAKEKPSIKYVYPKEGTLYYQDGYGLVKDAPHPDAAYAWFNYAMQADVAWLTLRDYPYTNANRAALEYAKTATFKVKDADGNEVTPAELYAAYIASPITNPPPEVIQKGYAMRDVGDALPLYDQLWTEVKTGH